MFHEWRIQPPAWTASLHVPPEDYPPNAGWALDSNGGRREVISKSCHRIVPVPNVSMPDMAISCRVPLEKLCPGCGTRLGWLFDFSNLPVQFFASERANAPKRVLYCPNCSCYGPVFSQYHHDGKVELHPATESDQTSSIEPGPSCGRAIIVTEQPPFAAADPFGIPYATSLGGVPMWLQDAEYPNCPDCHKTMTFLAQFDNGSMPTPEEGIFYAFFCEGCRVAAVNYQQTWATVPLLRSQSHGERRR
jgi:Domain of unknown function (DUF1963)